jgi:hypothetical protein
MSQAHKPETPFHLLRLTRAAEAKACFTSICGGGAASVSTEAGLIKLGMVSTMPYAVGLFAFLVVMSTTYNHMEHRAMHRGQFKLTTRRMPRINI